MSSVAEALSLTELQAVAALGAAFPPSEIAGEGVTLSSVKGRREWSFLNGPVRWRWASEPAETDFTAMTVPARLIWSAAELAGDLDVEWSALAAWDAPAAVSITVDGTVILFDALPRVDHAEAKPSWDEPDGAQATVTAGVLARLLRRGRNTPIGLDPEEAQHEVVLVIEDGAVAVCIDWRDSRTLRATQRTPAFTSGTATCEIDVAALHELLLCVPADTELTLTVADRDVEAIHVEAGALQASVPARPTSLQRLRHGLGQRIADATGGRCFRLDEHVYVVETGRHQIRVELHDDGLPVLRISTVLIDSIHATEALYEQINSANAGLTGVRLWLDGASVVGGVDLPESQIGALDETLWRFEAQLSGFDVFLSALGPAA